MDGAPVDGMAGGVGPFDSSHALWWLMWHVALAARMLAALTVRGSDHGVDPSRPVPPALPTEVWALIMDRAETCRCAQD